MNQKYTATGTAKTRKLNAVSEGRDQRKPCLRVAPAAMAPPPRQIGSRMRLPQDANAMPKVVLLRLLDPRPPDPAATLLNTVAWILRHPGTAHHPNLATPSR